MRGALRGRQLASRHRRRRTSFSHRSRGPSFPPPPTDSFMSDIGDFLANYRRNSVELTSFLIVGELLLLLLWLCLDPISDVLSFESISGQKHQLKPAAAPVTHVFHCSR